MKKLKKLFIASLIGINLIALTSCDFLNFSNNNKTTVTKANNTPASSTTTLKPINNQSTKSTSNQNNQAVSTKSNVTPNASTNTNANTPSTSNSSTNVSTNSNTNSSSSITTSGTSVAPITQTSTSPYTSTTAQSSTNISTIPTTVITTIPYVPTTTPSSTNITTITSATNTTGIITTTPTTAPSTNTSTSSTSSTNTGVEDDNIVIHNYSGYNEGIYVEVVKLNNTVLSDYNVYYKNSNDSNYIKIDKELIRDYNSVIRADIVGLKAGNYSLKVEINNSYKIIEDINVTNHDRSGFAHFNYTGVGAYNNDGTLKSNAVVVYVNENNKNTVKAKIGNNTYIGIAEIIKNAKDEKYPVDIRILGTVGAATWQKDSPAVSKYSSATTSTVKGTNGKYLELKNYSQEDIIDGKFNSLDESEYTKLEGLTNKIKYDSSKSEFDSYYNMLDITDAKNVTIEGIGVDATIFQWGFTWKGKTKSIEVRNLTFDDYTEDACSFEGSGKDEDLTSYSSFISTNYWIHNNTFNRGVNYWDVCSEQDKHDGDGATDFKRCAFVTVSYNHYYNNHKTGLVGGGDSQVSAAITFHHNFYDRCESRLPFARQANMHMYNNYYYSSTGNNMQIYAGAYAFIENCYFENVKKPFTLSSEYFKTADTTIKANKTYYNKNKEVVNYDAGTEISSSKINGVEIYEKRTPAIKSFNNIYSNCSSTGATIVSSREATVSNGNLYGPSFDTDTLLFDYDSENKKSNVFMIDTDLVPEFVSTYAGAGKLICLNAEIPAPVEPTPTDPIGNDDVDGEFKTIFNDDFKSNETITLTNNVPTSSGIYYHISDSETNASNNADDKNYISISNGSLNIHDESSTTTTWAYYMFDKSYNEGIIRYSIEFTPTKQSTSWSIIQFIGASERLSIRSDSSKSFGYTFDGSNVTKVMDSAYSANTKYTVIVTINYNDKTITISIDGKEVTISNKTLEISGVVFMTAKSAADRSYTVQNIKIEKFE